MADRTFALRSGRAVGVSTFGDPDAERLVVFCHAAPGSSVFDPDPDASAERHAHIVAIDRPGYGASEPWPLGSWPSITQAADDIAEYIRSVVVAETVIGVTRPRTVGVVGWSAGGRVALAVAARHPHLVDRVAIVGTPAPNEAVPWIDPKLQALSDELGAMAPGEAMSRLSAMLQPQADAVAAASEPGGVPLEMLGVGPVDQQALSGRGVHDRLGRMLKEAFRQGTGGVAGDILSYTARPWGFELGDVAAKTLIIAGQADAVAGYAHAAWYKKALPDSRMETMPGVGHLAIVPAWGRVLSHVAPAQLTR
ncbi:alpha/beta hydrolase [Leifsonia shinshuensis]|uniref:alpha/beta hydrolase n=1 Tax=Leifsonia shinshuensis TaxID=150026 RepID=UPI002859E914|nr:alpha/beta hydrolase [Leifsonia shinshuensis]MDR6971671.1 pimeloyl-ACP methyl ester carboxylesterase [Leifsonia shinshuensis]